MGKKNGKINLIMTKQIKIIKADKVRWYKIDEKYDLIHELPSFYLVDEGNGSYVKKEDAIII